MNIFFIDRDPVKCAQYHCDKHVVKLILETAQMLSTAHHVLDHQPLDGIYRATHKNHPSNVWVRSAMCQYNWTFELLQTLLEEYTFRYEKVHATARLIPLLQFIPLNIPQLASWQNPPQCMPNEFKHADTIEAYRAYYRIGKKHLLTYKKRSAPEWLYGN